MAAQGYDLENEELATRDDPTTLNNLFRRGGWQILDDELREGKVFFIRRHIGRPLAVLLPIETYDRLLASIPKTEEAAG